MNSTDLENIINSIAYDTSLSISNKLINIYRVWLLNLSNDLLEQGAINLFIQEKKLRIIKYSKPLILIKNGQLEYTPQFYKNIRVNEFQIIY